jgi:hypothetical protein
MKKGFFFPLVILVSFVLVSCEDKTPLYVTFEDVSLTDSIWNGSNGSGKFVTTGFEFQNSYNTAWSSWSGFACSAKKDTKTTGYQNQYSVITASGAANSAKFALAFDSAAIVCTTPVEIESMMLTNSTYAYLEIKNGSDYSKKFAADDWFKVTITGYKNKVKTSAVDYYLADFRSGKSFLSNTWAKVDLTALGTVDLVTFTFDSSDKGQWGVNTPQYVCIDNVEYFEPTSSK